MAVSEVLNIRPWEQRELLTVEELQAAFDYVDRLNEKMKQ